MISTRALNLLRRIAASEDGELVCEKGAGWWCGIHEVNGRDAMEILRWICIKRDGGNLGDGYQIYTINETGRKVLADPEKGAKEILEILRTSFQKSGIGS